LSGTTVTTVASNGLSGPSGVACGAPLTGSGYNGYIANYGGINSVAEWLAANNTVSNVLYTLT